MELKNQSVLEKYAPESLKVLRHFWEPGTGQVEFRAEKARGGDDLDPAKGLKNECNTIASEYNDLLGQVEEQPKGTMNPARETVLKELKGYIDRLKAVIDKDTVSNPLPPITHNYVKDDFGNPSRPARPGEIASQTDRNGPLTSEQRMEDWCKQHTPTPDIGQLSLGDCVRAWITGEFTEQTQRAMATTGTGGVLIPTPLSAQVIDLARNKSRVLQAGAATWPMESKTLTVPRQTGDPVAKWRPELGAINRTEATFEPVVLRACSLGALITLSVELVEDSVGLDAFLRTVLSNVIAEGVDQAALTGTGTTGDEDGERIEPVGVLSTANVQALDLNASLSSYQPFSQAVTMVHKVNGSPNAVMLSPVNMGILDALTATDGQPLMPPPSWERLQHLDTNQLEDSVAVVGDWTQVAIGIRHQVRLEFATTGHIAAQGSEEELNLFSQNAIALRVLWRGDVAVQRPDQFVKITNIGGSTATTTTAKSKAA